MAHVFVFYTLLLVACGYAGWLGGAPERLVAAVLIAGTLATWSATVGLTGSWFGHFRTVEYAILLVDCVMLVMLAGVALAADRFWPLWLTAIHGFGVVGHVARIIAPDIVTDVYKAAHAFSAYPGLILLILATRWHRQRLCETGHDRPWSISWALSTQIGPAIERTGFSRRSAR